MKYEICEGEIHLIKFLYQVWNVWYNMQEKHLLIIQIKCLYKKQVDEKVLESFYMETKTVITSMMKFCKS